MEFPMISGQHSDFFNALAPIVCNEWVKRRRNGERTISPAVAMAQAALESGYNINASSLFGIKGEGFTSPTEEYIDGIKQDIVDSFVKYPSIGASIVGYYDLMQDDNYADATAANTVEGELYGLTNAVDEGYDANGNWVGYNYATDPEYYSKCLWIVNEYGLRAYNDYVWSVVNDDNTSSEPVEQPSTEIDENVVDAIYRGEYGNGDERKERLEAEGYNYADYQARVEEKYYSNSDDTDSTPTESEPVTLTEGMEVRFTGACDTNGTPLAYTDRTYVINSFSDDREKVLLDIYGEHYAWVWASEVVPV